MRIEETYFSKFEIYMAHSIHGFPLKHEIQDQFLNSKDMKDTIFNLNCEFQRFETYF